MNGHGKPEDTKTLLSIADQAIGKTICVFAEAFGWPIQSYIAKFPEEFEALIKKAEPHTGKKLPMAAAGSAH